MDSDPVVNFLELSRGVEPPKSLTSELPFFFIKSVLRSETIKLKGKFLNKNAK